MNKDQFIGFKVSEAELRRIQEATREKYGSAEGRISLFCRHAVLAKANCKTVNALLLSEAEKIELGF
jgi:hypothetical protein